MLKLYQMKVSHIPSLSFSWKLEGDNDQKAYQIKVFDEDNNLVWNSGIVASENRHNIRIGTGLEKYVTYSWEVTVWDNTGASASAEGGTFEVGKTDWKAKWIEPVRIRKELVDSNKPIHGTCEQKDPFEILDPAIDMRRSFFLEQIPKKAYIYASARGIYALKINGVLVSDLFAPGYTSYGKRIEYQCMNVSNYLKEGMNVIAVTLADGWYTGKIGAVGIGQQYGHENAMIWQLDALIGNKWDTLVVSDEKIKFKESAWQYADLFMGSAYDETKEEKGWELAEYDDSNWAVVKVCDYGYDELTWQTIPSIKEERIIKPKLFKAPNGDTIIDAGEIIVGFLKVQINMKAGEFLKLEHTEVLDKAGNFMMNIVGQNKNQTDQLIASTDGVHKWSPMFTNHGFRYVRVSGISDFSEDDFEIVVIHTPMTETGKFSCNDQRLNILQENIVRSQKGNMIGIPTDCPQREKTGWTGDMQVYAPTACLEMDVEMFVRHWLQDMQNEQLEDGQIPHIIPYIPSHDIMKPAWIDGVSAGGWSDACVIVPWRLYENYGDKSILEENYQMMTRYMDSLKIRVAASPKDCPQSGDHMNYIWNNDFQYGDWLMPSAVKSGLVGSPMMMLTGIEAGTLMYAYTNMLMVRVCKELGYDEKALEYENTYHKVCEAFAIEFVNDDGTLKKDFQGLYILALAKGAIPEAGRKNAISKLVEIIHLNDDRLDTGFLSIPFLLPVLHDYGQKELANILLFQDKEPSWLYEIKCGATTLWESWDAIDEDGSPKDYSMNHFAFGCVGEYLYKYIAGIKSINSAYKVVQIKPDFECGLKEVLAEYDSIWGCIKVHWKVKANSKTLDVTIPPNVTGKIVINDIEKEVSCGSYTFTI